MTFCKKIRKIFPKVLSSKFISLINSDNLIKIFINIFFINIFYAKELLENLPKFSEYNFEQIKELYFHEFQFYKKEKLSYHEFQFYKKEKLSYHDKAFVFDKYFNNINISY